MAITKIEKNQNPNDIGAEYWCDTTIDIANLPKNANITSTAIDISKGDIYTINSAGEWIKICKGNTL